MVSVFLQSLIVVWQWKDKTAPSWFSHSSSSRRPAPASTTWPFLSQNTLLQSSNVRDWGALGSGSRNWFSTALSRQFHIKCNMFSQRETDSPRRGKWAGTIKGATTSFSKPPSASSGLILSLPLVTLTPKLSCFQHKMGVWGVSLGQAVRLEKAEVTLTQTENSRLSVDPSFDVYILPDP